MFTTSDHRKQLSSESVVCTQTDAREIVVNEQSHPDWSDSGHPTKAGAPNFLLANNIQRPTEQMFRLIQKMLPR